jgi:hypothetical protein
MALATFKVDVVELSKLTSDLDVLAFFNTLDHQDRPLEVLERALDLARFVVIELHDDDEAGKQHLFVINQALARTAREKGWNFVEVSEAINQEGTEVGDRIYIVSQKAAIPSR